MVVGLFLCGRDRLARQPLAVHVVSQITFMVGGGGKLWLKSKSCESASPPILHILVSLATPVVVNGSWGNLGPLRIIVLNLVIKAFAFDYADSILARRNRLFEEDYE